MSNYGVVLFSLIMVGSSGVIVSIVLMVLSDQFPNKWLDRTILLIMPVSLWAIGLGLLMAVVRGAAVLLAALMRAIG